VSATGKVRRVKVVFHFETEIEDPLPDESIEDYVWWLTDEYGHSGLSAFISDYADD
jgi:hypothetical protein